MGPLGMLIVDRYAQICAFLRFSLTNRIFVTNILFVVMEAGTAKLNASSELNARSGRAPE